MTADTKHPAFQQPLDSTIKVWRYMDFAKYVSLLKEQSLYFAKINTFSDPFEGSLSKDEYEHLTQLAKIKDQKKETPNDSGGNHFDDLMRNTRRSLKQNYASCWHMNSVESEAMWKLYSNSDYAISIQSTYQLLADSLPDSYEPKEHIGPYIGSVQYVNHHQDKFPTGNIFHPIMHKHPSFKHEQECRAIIWRSGPKDYGPDLLPEYILDSYPCGINVPIELNNLVEKVIVAPSTPEWFYEIVSDLTSKYGFSFSVEHSSLALKPYL